MSTFQVPFMYPFWRQLGTAQKQVALKPNKKALTVPMTIRAWALSDVSMYQFCKCHIHPESAARTGTL